MENKRTMEKFINDMSALYRNLKDVFDIGSEEFKQLLTNLILAAEYNKDLFSSEFDLESFKPEFLKKLKGELSGLGFDNNAIREFIVKSPILLVYANKLDRVYYIYKNNKCHGYSVLYDYRYSTFLVNENLKSSVVENNYITDQMLRYYAKGEKSEISKNSFDELLCSNKVKNYYFKKKPMQQPHTDLSGEYSDKKEYLKK